MSEIQNMKQILRWDGNGYCIQSRGQVSDLSWEKKCCSWIKKRMNLITSLNLCLSLKCGTILPMKLTNMQRQGLHKDVSKNKYVLFYILYFFTMLHDSTCAFFHGSLNDSGSATLNCFSRSFLRAVHNWTGMVVGFLSGQILSWATHIFIMSLCHAQASMSVCHEEQIYIL